MSVMEIEDRLTRAVPVRTIVRDVAGQLAPDELPLLDSLYALDDEEVARRFARGEKQEALAFGFGELAAMTSPVAWIALDEAARRFGGKSADGVARGARGVLRKVLRQRAEPVTLPPLTRAQLASVRETILRSAKERGLGDAKAVAIADAVISYLAITPPEPVPGDGHDNAAPR